MASEQVICSVANPDIITVFVVLELFLQVGSKVAFDEDMEPHVGRIQALLVQPQIPVGPFCNENCECVV